MYTKCGSVEDARNLFDTLPDKDAVTWTAMIAGYAKQGMGQEALTLYRSMRQEGLSLLVAGYTRQGDSEALFDLLDRMRLEGIQPDGVTFLHALTVCSHASLVDKGRKYFEAMTTDFGISPTVDHYICMLDLLGRAGHLHEALQMAITMPFPSNGAVWLTLLGACRKWNNVEIGRQAFEFAVNLDERDATSYVLMSSIYAGGRKKCGAWKPPGQSWWTDMVGVVHTFVVGDQKSPESEGIYARLVP